MDSKKKVIVSKTASGYAVAVLAFVGATVKTENTIAYEPHKKVTTPSKEWVEWYAQAKEYQRSYAAEIRKKQLMGNIRTIRAEIKAKAQLHIENGWIQVDKDTKIKEPSIEHIRMAKDYGYEVAASKLINRILTTKA